MLKALCRRIEHLHETSIYRKGRTQETLPSTSSKQIALRSPILACLSVMPDLHSDSGFRLSEDSISHSRRHDAMWRLRLEYSANMALTSRQHSTTGSELSLACETLAALANYLGDSSQELRSSRACLTAEPGSLLHNCTFIPS